VRIKHINCTMIMSYKLGLEFEKKNSNMQKNGVRQREYVCSKEESP